MAVKHHEAEIESHETMKFHSKPLCCIVALLNCIVLYCVVLLLYCYFVAPIANMKMLVKMNFEKFKRQRFLPSHPKMIFIKSEHIL